MAGRTGDWWRVGDILDGNTEALADRELEAAVKSVTDKAIPRLHAVLLWKHGKTCILVEHRVVSCPAGGQSEGEWVVIAVGRELVCHHVAKITGHPRQEAVNWVEKRAPQAGNRDMVAWPLVSMEAA